MRLRDCPSEGFDWRDLKIVVRYVDCHSHLYRKLFPEAADWDLQNQLVATSIDIQRWFQWVRGGCEGAPPDQISRPGVKPPEGSWRRGKAKRSVANKALGMKLGDVDPERLALIRAAFRGPVRGPVRDLRNLKQGR